MKYDICNMDNNTLIEYLIYEPESFFDDLYSLIKKKIKEKKGLIYMLTEKASGISIPEDREYEIQNDLYNIECEIYSTNNDSLYKKTINILSLLLTESGFGIQICKRNEEMRKIKNIIINTIDAYSINEVFMSLTNLTIKSNFVNENSIKNIVRYIETLRHNFFSFFDLYDI